MEDNNEGLVQMIFICELGDVQVPLLIFRGVLVDFSTGVTSTCHPHLFPHLLGYICPRPCWSFGEFTRPTRIFWRILSAVGGLDPPKKRDVNKKMPGPYNTKNTNCPHQDPTFKLFWNPWGRLFLRKPEKFKLLFPGDLVGSANHFAKWSQNGRKSFSKFHSYLGK